MNDADAPGAPTAPLLGAPRAVLAGAALLVLADAIAIVVRQAGSNTRGLLILYDAAHHLAAALVVAGTAALWIRFGPRRAVSALLPLGIAAAGICAPVLAPDLVGFATRWAPVSVLDLAVWSMAILASLAVSGAAALGAWLARGWRRLAPLALGAGVVAANHLLLRNDYPGAHLLAASVAWALFAAGLGSLPLPAWSSKVTRAVPWSLAALLGAWSLLAWPSNTLLVDLLRVDGSTMTPLFARLRAVAGPGKVSVPRRLQPWFSERSRARAAPAGPPLFREPPVVVLVTIDAVRADTVYSRKHDAKLPELARLRDHAIDFTLARANGSQTVYSLGTLFAGTYFSQQYWVPHPKHPHRFPHEDPTPRFPEILAQRGVATVTFAGAFWIVNEFGVVRGFQEERWVQSSRYKYTPAAEVVAPAIERLERHGSGPLFLFVHFLDPHAPYEIAGTRGSKHDRWLGEVSLADRALGRLRKALGRPELARRSVLIVSSDHGEAFGEHGTTEHATTLYEELIRVPLFVELPGVAARKVDTPVSLVDLGPTILDLFGIETPGHFMGQSLAAALRGRKLELTRPIVAEGRLKRAMIFDDGLKAIVDERVRTHELYDLSGDPGEKRNLADAEGAATDRIELLRAFFEAHRIRRPGYTIPLRK